MTREHNDRIVDIGIATTFSQSEGPRPIRVEAEREVKTKVLDNIGSYPAAEYGCSTIEEYLDGFVDRVIAHPDNVHMMFAGGETGTGKTAVLHEAAAKMVLPERVLEGGKVSKRQARTERTRLIKEAEKKGYQVVFHNFPWGDASEYLDDDWYIDKEADYHKDPQLRAGKQQEVNYAEAVMQEAIVRKVRECAEAAKRGEKVINIFIGDVPINTGEIINGQQYGVVRAHSLVRNMMHHEGPFREIKDDYEASFFTLSASTDVREKALADRLIMANKDLTDEEKQKLLLVQGTDFNTAPEEAQALIKEIAVPKQMELIGQDVNEVLIPLHALADDKIRPGFRYENVITTDDLKGRKDQLRVPMIGAIQLPHVLQDVLHVPPGKNTANFFNFRVVDRVDMFGWLVNSRPIADMRDDIKREIREKEQRGERLDWEHDYYNVPPPDFTPLGEQHF